LATDEVVEKKCDQLLKLLDALRSAKGERTTKVVEGEWKVKSLFSSDHLIGPALIR
jgi:hypothetical protein